MQIYLHFACKNVTSAVFVAEKKHVSKTKNYIWHGFCGNEMTKFLRKNEKILCIFD